MIALGRIGAPHGIKGWVRLISFTDPIDNILEYGEFQVQHGAVMRRIVLDEARRQGKFLVAHIEGCDDRELARQYTGQELLVPTDSLPALEQGSYYWHQLVGLKVLNLSGEVLGAVDHLMETGANDVLVLKPVSASIDDRERLIPYLKDTVVKQVDLVGGTLTVDWEADF